MASGETLCIWTALSNEPPASNYATLDSRNSQPCLDFDAATDEEAVFSGVMPRNYGGGGITATIVLAATSATTGNVVMQAAFERHQAETDDIDSDSFTSFQSSGAVAVPGTSGTKKYVTIAFTDGAQMDSVAAGEEFRFKIRRDADDTSATDSVTGDIEVSSIELKET